MAYPKGVKGWAALIVGGALILGALLPVGFIVTIMLLPVWRLVEADTGIESVGHSGPAEWCFWLVYGLLAAGAAWAMWRKARGA